MAKCGGSIVLSGDKNYYGAGHNVVCTFDEIDYLIFHGYHAGDNKKAKLRIEKITLDKNDRPFLSKTINTPYKMNLIKQLIIILIK